MNHQSSRYFTHTPIFPKRAFIGYITGIKQHSQLYTYPLPQVFTTHDEFIGTIIELSRKLEPLNVEIKDKTIILPILFDQYWAMKKDYWNSQTTPYSDASRNVLFMKVLQHYKFFNILITPKGYVQKQDFFDAPFAFCTHESHNAVEQFMMGSNFPVDQKSKYAAIYTTAKPFISNWHTGEYTQEEYVALRRLPH